ncbi:MAG: hypothetical protein IJ207_08675 [Treponema sp.]|uniref:hypothetical protein n=1 Tax=Treponema sp. TaxID=166 RepID=UPI0025CF7921|nr:hypothetical protein [Treponema sp.]MBQ9282255.1 hypothetical protein [Treponema sp.]
MRKAINIILAAAILLAGCANDGDSDNSVNANASNSNTDSNAEYTVTFERNFPEITSERTFAQSSKPLSEVSPCFPENMKGSPKTSITIPDCGYYYNFISLATYETISNNFYFSHWNTNNDDSGTSYTVGQVITLTENLTLYAIYKEDSGNNAEDSDNNNDETNILDMATTTEFSMKVGESVTLKPSWTYGDDCYYTITSNDDDAITLSGKVITAEKIGTAIVKMTANASSSAAGWCTISVTAEGFEGKVLENKLLGIWKYIGSSSSGTIVLNSDMTGHITAYLNGSTVHDNDFTWSAYEGKSGSTTYQFLTLKGTGVSSLDCDHQITNLSSAKFTMKGYLAFGMPSETTWEKQ